MVWRAKMTRKIFKFAGQPSGLDETKEENIYSTNCLKVYNELKKNKYKKILVVGKVQSGKTKNMIELCSKILTDSGENNFNNVILLTGTKTNLNRQTYERFNAFFENTNINVINFDNPMAKPDNKFEKNIYISLKNSSKLRKLINIFSTGYTSGKTLIIDDEADHASLNTHNKKDDGKVSPTYKNVISLLNCNPLNYYIGYTATPQGFLLGGQTNQLSPEKYVHINPGSGYFGVSDFIDNIDDYCVEIDDIDPFSQAGYPSQSLRTAIFYYLSTVLSFEESDIFDKEYGVNMVVHNSSLITNHITLEKTVKELIEEFNYINKCNINVVPLVLNSSNENNNIFFDSETKARNCIIIGGELLSRGFTIPNMIVFYSSKQVRENNVDTIYQRMRFCGYREKYVDHIRIYIPIDMIGYYHDIAANEKLILDFIGSENPSIAVKPEIDNNKIWFIASKKNLFPTRKSVVYKNVMVTNASGSNVLYCKNNLKQFATNREKLIDKLGMVGHNEFPGMYAFFESNVEHLSNIFDILDIESSVHSSVSAIINTIKYSLEHLLSNDSIKISILVSDSILDSEYVPGTNYRTVKNNIFPFMGDSERKSIKDYGINDDIVIFLNRMTLKYADGEQQENIVINIKIPDSKELTYYEI